MGVTEDRAAKKARALRRILGDSEAEKLGLVPRREDEAEEIAGPVTRYQSLFQETQHSNPAWIYVDGPGRKVFRTDDSVIKFGPDIDIREAETMQFIKEATTIPVPIATVDSPDAIVMKYVDGDNLQDSWPHYSSEEKRSIAEQMLGFLDQLRALQGTYIGAVNRGPAIDNRKGTRIGGPFDNESKFNQFLLNQMISSTPLLHREAMECAMRGEHEIVFCHADLNLRNIVVKEGKIVALLDWETAGWYPNYWEYVKFCFASCHDKEWHDLGHTMFPRTYPEELVRDQYYALFVF